MKKITTKLLSLCLVVFILTSLLSGCSQGIWGEIEAAINDFLNQLATEFADSTESSEQSGNTENQEHRIVENGQYTNPNDVAAYINEFKKLPSNFITKSEAEALGWDSSKGNLNAIAPGKSIGGDYFGNYEKKLPSQSGRKYTECDVNYISGYRGAERIIFSNDGLIYYTGDHYETFIKLYENGVKVNEINNTGTGNK